MGLAGHEFDMPGVHSLKESSEGSEQGLGWVQERVRPEAWIRARSLCPQELLGEIIHLIFRSGV